MKSDVQGTAGLKVIANLLSTIPGSRADMQRWLMDSSGRDINAECGYPDNPDHFMYRKWFDREGVAARVVGVYPDECWAVNPSVYQTEKNGDTAFETAWTRLEEDLNIWHYLHRVDEVSGIGRFGVLFLGLTDGVDLSRPAAPGGRLLYLRAFDETQVTVSKIDNNPAGGRYKLPELYTVQFGGADVNEGGGTTVESLTVHWTRVIHVADNRVASEIYGQPRMEKVFNRLWDIRKVLSGSAEMFWKGAFPGYSFETTPDANTSGGALDTEMTEEDIAEQVKRYEEGLQRYFTLTGMTVKPLAPQMADPTNHITQQLQAIAIALGVPVRVFTGSEAGHLASTQDAGTWNRRVARRQTQYLNPMVIRVLVDRLILLGVLPAPANGYKIAWTDLAAQSEKDKADVTLKKAQSLVAYSTSGAETTITPRDFFIHVMGMSPELAEVVVAAAEAVKKKVTPGAQPEPKPVVGAGRQPANAGSSASP